MQEPDNAGSSEKRAQQTQSAGKPAVEAPLPVIDPVNLTSTTNHPTPVGELPERQKSDNSDNSRENVEKPPPVVLKDKTEVISPKESKTSERWRNFVDEVANHASVSLVSLLRNSVVLELTDKELVIGYQNIQVYTETKRTKVEEIARDFFNDSIRVIFKESDDGLDDSLQVKHDNAKAKEIEEIKAVAKDDIYAQEILKIFPDAEIQEITILDDTEEGKR